MAALIIEAAMVNPKGKAERLHVAPSLEVLNNEWVQVRNTSAQPSRLDGISLMHLTYQAGQDEPKQSLIMRLQGVLPPYTGLRIHSGRGKPSFDAQLNIYHSYINPKVSQFLFQIIRPDRIFLVKDGRLMDVAGYTVPVPENKRLKRVAPVERQLLQPI